MGHPDPVPGGFRRPALRAARRLHQAPLAYDFDPDAPEPKAWLKFLHEDLWPGDPDSVACLQR